MSTVPFNSPPSILEIICWISLSRLALSVLLFHWIMAYLVMLVFTRRVYSVSIDIIYLVERVTYSLF